MTFRECVVRRSLHCGYNVTGGGWWGRRSGSGSKRSTLDIEGKIAEWRGRERVRERGRGGERAASPSAPPPLPEGGSPPHSRTQLLLEGEEVVCALVPVQPPAALIDDLKTRFDAKDEDTESGIGIGIHESE